MIFEVPVDHFPPQHDRVQRAASLLPILFKMQSRNEISANVEVLTPSVRHSQFAFPLPSQRTFPDTQIPREDSLTSLKKAVHSATSKLNVEKIFSLPLQVLSFAIPVPQIS